MSPRARRLKLESDPAISEPCASDRVTKSPRAAGHSHMCDVLRQRSARGEGQQGMKPVLPPSDQLCCLWNGILQKDVSFCLPVKFVMRGGVRPQAVCPRCVRGREGTGPGA